MNQLKNISEGGSAPESRLNDAREVLEMVRGLVRSDEPRAKNRSRLKGLVDGNPPYNAAELKRNGLPRYVALSFLRRVRRGAELRYR